MHLLQRGLNLLHQAAAAAVFGKKRLALRPADEEPQPKRHRHKSLYDIVRDEEIAAAKGNNHKVFIIGAAFRNRVKERVDEVRSTQHLKDAYDSS